MESTGTHHPSTTHSDLGPPDADLVGRYQAILTGSDTNWAVRCCDLRIVGRGGQGVVFLARSEGADGFAIPISLKVYSPEPYRTAAAYAEDMTRVAAIAARVAAVQH